ncbi:hypothetical protein B0H14DRAFT_3479942 [Mycena olivaceomarginata]|nr:hypothetical protein B0H14DRAFT_3479942 [Mycena olivaceomarginata]
MAKGASQVAEDTFGEALLKSLEEWEKGKSEEFVDVKLDPEEEAERDRAWNWALEICLENMPEWDRQAWVREKREEEEHERRYKFVDWNASEGVSYVD